MRPWASRQCGHGLAANADMKGENPALGIIAQKRMSGGVAEMLEIQRCGRVICRDLENAIGHLRQLAARFQHRQRTFQAGQVERVADLVVGVVHDVPTLDRRSACDQYQNIAAVLAS